MCKSLNIAADSAGWFWRYGKLLSDGTIKDLNTLADKDDVNEISRLVNGGEKARKERLEANKQLKKNLNMKIVLIKNRLLLPILSMLIIGCSKKEKLENRQNGFFVEFPFIEQKSFLIKNSKMRLEMNKVLTKTKIDYNLGFEGKKLFPLPFNRDVNDFSPILDIQMDSLVQKDFNGICDSCFVLKYEYGTGNIKWNYLFRIKNKKIYLEDLIFIEPFDSQSDTLAYIAKINLNKPISALNINSIKKSMDMAEKRNTKNSIYIKRP